MTGHPLEHVAERARPQTPQFSQLHTDYLDRLGAAGVRPEDVDVVVDTHLHHDHVGWNTRLEVDTWAPTFPHATYLLPRADHDYFAAADATFPRLLIADSIEPVANAGRLRLWQDGPRIDDTLRRSRRGRREARTGTGHLRHRALGGPVTPVRG